MALSERLAYLIDANADKAIRTFEKVGTTAEKELGKADARIDKFGVNATRIGAGMLAFSGVAAGALLSFANAAEDANQSQLDLQNTLANAPRLAGETAEKFNDLAKALQSKTAADGDAIVSGIAVLGNFGLTAKEIERLTPLLVDYAQFTGKDMSTAATDVGKALQGQGRALRSVGLNLKDAGSEAGNFSQVVDGLAGKVGGFAEREGQTFSGQMQRLKNELGDVQEGLGVGVVGALNTLLGPATRFSGWLSDASPQTQEFTGRLFAIGTASVGAVGGLSLIAGQIVKMRDAFTVTNIEGTRTLTTLGKFARGAGIAGGIAGIGLALWEVVRASQEVNINIEQMARSATSQLVTSFLAIDSAAEGLKNNFTPEELELYQRNIEDRQKAFFGALAAGSIGTAERLRDALKAQGKDVSALDRILRNESAAQKQASADANAGADAFGGVGGSAKGAAREVKTLGDRMGEVLGGAFDVANAETDVLEAFDQLQQRANEGAEERADLARRHADAVEDSARRIRDAEQDVADAREDLNKIASGDRTDARRRLRDAEQGLADTRADGADSVAEAADELERWTPTLDEATEAGRENREVLQEIVEKSVEVADKMAEQGESSSAINGYLTTQRTKLETIGTQLGFNRDRLREYTDLLGTVASLTGGTRQPGSADSLERQVERGLLTNGGVVIENLNVVSAADTADAIGRAIMRELSLFGGRR